MQSLLRTITLMVCVKEQSGTSHLFCFALEMVRDAHHLRRWKGMILNLLQSLSLTANPCITLEHDYHVDRGVMIVVMGKGWGEVRKKRGKRVRKCDASSKSNSSRRGRIKNKKKKDGELLMLTWLRFMAVHPVVCRMWLPIIIITSP